MLQMKRHADATGIVITPLAFIKATKYSETERDFCDPLFEKLHKLWEVADGPSPNWLTRVLQQLRSVCIRIY